MVVVDEIPTVYSPLVLSFLNPSNLMLHDDGQ